MTATAISGPTENASEKPLLRGVSHAVAFVLALPATALVASRAPDARASAAILVYGAALAAQYGVSALYHRVTWAAPARARMRRLDHACIFLLIAGSYTPLFVLVPGGSARAVAIVWAGAALGVAKSIAWAHAPKWITAILCVALGWALAGEVIARGPVAGWPCVLLLVASGAVYSVGALVYALKRPDPLPRTFGYHEVFHAIVVAASLLAYAHVWSVVSFYLSARATTPSPVFVQ